MTPGVDFNQQSKHAIDVVQSEPMLNCVWSTASKKVS